MYFLPTKKWPPSRLGWLAASFLLFGLLLGQAYSEHVASARIVLTVLATLMILRVVYLYMFRD